MSGIVALCDICHVNIAKHTCKLCGRRVCDEHFVKEKGVCTSEVKGRQAKGRG